MKRGRGRPRGFGDAPKKMKDRFQKFYFEHRERLNEERRKQYQERKEKGLCVRCEKKVAKGSVFCSEHREISKQKQKQVKKSEQKPKQVKVPESKQKQVKKSEPKPKQKQVKKQQTSKQKKK